MVRTIPARISNELFAVRRKHKEELSKALHGLKISDVEIDKIYTRRLRNLNIMEEFKFK